MKQREKKDKIFHERNAWNLVFTVLEDVAGHTVENRRAILIARKGL